MDAGHLLTNRDFQRVGDAVRRVEGTYNIAGESAEQRGGSNVQVLQIQAGAANDFGYPARIQKWSSSAGTWSDLSTTEVRVEDPNGGASFSASQYVLARFLGVNSSNVGCFAIDGRYDADCAPGCGWIAGLIVADCLSGSIISATGRCTTDTNTAWTSTFTRANAAADWVAADTLEVSNVAYTVTFLRDHDPEGGDPQLTLTYTSTVYWATLDCCGDGYAIFAIGVVCTGATLCPPTTAGSNVVRIRVEWSVCPNPDYYGAGWYCVSDDSCVTSTASYLATDPGVCGPTNTGYFEICAGPFETEAVANTVCALPDDPPEVPAPCTGIYTEADFATIICVLSNPLSGCACVTPAQIPLFSTGVSGGAPYAEFHSGTTDNGCGVLSVLFPDISGCVGGFYVVGYNPPFGTAHTTKIVYFTESPFLLVADYTWTTVGGNPCDSPGSFRLTFMIP